MREEIIKELKTVYDPEITSINIFDLGLVYDIDIKDKDVTITHTLTSMFCPMADEISKNIKEAVSYSFYILKNSCSILKLGSYK